MGSGADQRESSASLAVGCRWCGKITGYKAVPGTEQEHRGWIDCIQALQTRLDGLLNGLATAASKERESRGIKTALKGS
jgi:hypothetical protein